jgi:hypothetical protein
MRIRAGREMRLGVKCAPGFRQEAKDRGPAGLRHALRIFPTKQKNHILVTKL